jgi:hypothetical protein
MAGCAESVPAPQASKNASETTAPNATAPEAATSAVARDTPPRELSDTIPDDVAKLVTPLSIEQIRDGWIMLFDGDSLFGWESNQPEVNWSVEEGTITADSGPAGLLLTKVPFADYELHCEFQMAAGGNSGIFLRTATQPKDVMTDCYELNIVDEHPAGFLTGSFVGRQAAKEPLTGSGGWKSFDVRCQGNHFEVDLDGRRVLDYRDESTGARNEGLIGLQKNAGKIQFRNVRVRPLLESLFNGSTLAQWQKVPGSKAEFTVEAETIHCQGGAGFLETTEDYGDFILQLDAATRAPDVNSGVFFRAEPGTEAAPSNGYELQIDNSTVAGDRSKPKNSGSGAIFRRVESRYVAADDFQWATLTLVAAGPRVMSWVNGYPVVDWEDTRTPNANPRKGRRLEPGRISLQGHDPTTDVSFRNLKIGRLPRQD